jgi:hypothetical protein
MSPVVRALVSFALIGVAALMIVLASDGPPLHTLLPIALFAVFGTAVLYVVRWYVLRRMQ